MSSGSAAPLIVEAGQSRRLAAYLVIAHAAALVVSLVLPIGFPWHLLLVVALFVSLAHSLYTHGWRRGARAVVKVEVQQGRPWVLHLRSGRAISARLLGSSFVHPRLLVLNFSTGRLFRRTLVLAEDAADPDLLRQLRVRLMCLDGEESSDSITSAKAR